MDKVSADFESLYRYCRDLKYEGYDPYDGLNSRLFQLTPFYRSKFSRQLWTQFFKLSPFNLRPLFLIKPGYNPKAISLFILGLSEQYRKDKNPEYLEQLKFLAALLNKLSLKGYSGNCWGYNFPWQSRAFYASANTPNAICTVFAAKAFLSLYEDLGDKSFLDTALNCVDFFCKDLKRTPGPKDGFCFSYTPLDATLVHNINLLVASTIAQANIYLKSNSLGDLAYRAVSYSVNAQNSDGSWDYGAASNQRWVDNFHTGYNLIALKSYQEYSGSSAFLSSLKKGYKFFNENLFLNGCIPKYFPDKTYPVDIHSIAVAIITYSELLALDADAYRKAGIILEWALSNMFDKRGYFYFQKYKYHTVKISYMRWAQAWMFYAIALYRAAKGRNNEKS